MGPACHHHGVNLQAEFKLPEEVSGQGTQGELHTPESAASHHWPPPNGPDSHTGAGGIRFLWNIA